MKAEPIYTTDGIPMCAYNGCGAYDRLRCELMKAPPHAVCVPAVAALRSSLALTEGAMRADDARLRAASIRIWGEDLHGCDAPDAMADLVIHLRSSLETVKRERDEARRDHEGACLLVAKMHHAATGSTGGPKRGVVEDVEDVRLRAEEAETRAEDLRLAMVTLADEAEQERRTAEAAVKFLGRIAEVTWDAGLPSGDREQTLKNARTLASRLAESEAKVASLVTQGLAAIRKTESAESRLAEREAWHQENADALRRINVDWCAKNFALLAERSTLASRLAHAHSVIAAQQALLSPEDYAEVDALADAELEPCDVLADRLQTAEDDRDDLAWLLVAAHDMNDWYRGVVDADNAACLCGCPLSEHESVDEGVEQCEHEDHVCLRTCPAIAQLYVAARDGLAKVVGVMRASRVTASDHAREIIDAYLCPKGSGPHDWGTDGCHTNVFCRRCHLDRPAQPKAAHGETDGGRR